MDAGWMNGWMDEWMERLDNRCQLYSDFHYAWEFESSWWRIYTNFEIGGNLFGRIHNIPTPSLGGSRKNPKNFFYSPPTFRYTFIGHPLFNFLYLVILLALPTNDLPTPFQNNLSKKDMSKSHNYYHRIHCGWIDL